jgi:hypothetical protein
MMKTDRLYFRDGCINVYAFDEVFHCVAASRLVIAAAKYLTIES